MTEDELFEQWLNNNYLFDTAEFITNEQEKNLAKQNNIVRKAWRFRAELADIEKAELQAQVELARTYKRVSEARHAELQAQINELREALEAECGGRCNAEYNPCHARQALAKTAPQCLQERDNDVIEMCAKVCDEAGQPHQDEIHTDAQWAAKVLAANIRALKGK